MKSKTGFLAIAVILGIGSVANTASSQSVNCSGLSGAAFGLCIGAEAIQCDGSDTDAAGCNKIESRFGEITGTTPPWTLPLCPCGSAADFVAHIESLGTPDITCSVIPKVVNFLGIHTAGTSDSLVFTTLPPVGSTLNFCGIDNNILFDVDDDEAESCANNIEATAANFGTVCTGL